MNIAQVPGREPVRFPIPHCADVCFHVRLFLLVFVTLSCLTTGYARVFLRSGLRANEESIGETLGWQKVYETHGRIGTGAGDLQVWAGVGHPHELNNRLRAGAPARRMQFFGTAGHALAWNLEADSAGIIRRLIVPSGPARCLIFSFSQRTDDFAASLREPVWLLEDIPPFPDSEPRRFVADDGRGSALQTSFARSDPASVSAFYSDFFTQSGWAMLLPRTADGEIRPLEIYARGQEICLVHAVYAGTEGGTSLMILHNSSGTKPLSNR